MGRPEVFIKHTSGNKIRKQLRVRPDRSQLFLIGSSKEADLRLSGDGVSGCHTVLRYRDSHWYVCDVSGDGEPIKADGPSFIERQLDGPLQLEIGPHKLTLFSREAETDLFKGGAADGDKGLHQVVVRVNGRVVDTRVLKANEPYRLRAGLEKTELPAPKDGNWVITEIGKRVVQQRLVGSQEIADGVAFEIDNGLRRPLLVSVVAGALVMMLMILMSKTQPKTVAEAKLDQKSMDMIFNAKAIKKKKAEVQKMASKKTRAGGNNQVPAQTQSAQVTPEQSTAPTKVSAKTSAALTSLRQSGLSALVGKIAKRANKQGVLVAASGASPDTRGSGRAFFSAGTSTTGGGGTAAAQGKSFKLGGVGTQGRAGGAGNFKDGTALAGGSVGMGDVAVVDEETLIDGGLDREVIAEVIKRNIGQIRYCYERQLSSNPDLYGKILVKFMISGTGDVGDPRIDSSTMKSPMVEGCILRRLAGWKFPLPKGGTTVKVAYPFLFKALD
jgi:outer membrane biosynthesis protein TonB